jgi:hypothetical protein
MAKKAKPNPIAEFGAGILETLGQPPDAGAFWTLRRAAQCVRPQSPDDDLRAALAVKPLKGAAVCAFPDDIDAPVVLKADARRLAESDELLKAVMQRLCSPEMPQASLAVLKSPLTKSLQAPFSTSWSKRIKGKSLPDFASVTSTKVGKKTTFELHDVRFPRREQILSARILTAMEAAGREAAQYPCRITDLCRDIGEPETTPECLMALSVEPCLSSVVTVYERGDERILALRADLEAASTSAIVLRAVISFLRKPLDNLVPVAKLEKDKSLSPDARGGIANRIAALVSENRMPDGIGAIYAGKKLCAFLAEDAVMGTATSPPQNVLSPETAYPTARTGSDSPTGSTAEVRPAFAADFEAAFDQLDRQSGLRNYLKLLDLRQALRQYSRLEFDTGLAELRRARRFALESSEGSRVTLTDEERGAGIMEAGNLLTYCSRRK